MGVYGDWTLGVKYETHLFVFTSPCDPPVYTINFLDGNGKKIWAQLNITSGYERSQDLPQVQNMPLNALLFTCKRTVAHVKMHCSRS